MSKLRKLLGISSTSSANQASAQMTATWIAAGVFLVGLVASALFGNAISAQNANEYAQSLMQERNALSSFVRVRVGAYNQLLYASAVMVSMKPDMQRTDWQDLYTEMHIHTDFPELAGIGYVTNVKDSELDIFRDGMNTEYQSFDMRPAHSRELRTAITYLQPESPENKQAIGFDMFSEERHSVAMAAARDQGHAVMSEPVPLVQDVDKKNSPPGVLVYYPIYEPWATVETIEQRREHLRGFVYTVIRPHDIANYYNERFPEAAKRYDVRVYDVSNHEEALYAVNNSKLPDYRKRIFSEDLEFDNQVWRVEVSGQNRMLHLYVGPLMLFILGGLLSAAAGYIILRSLKNRISRVEETYVQEVQRTKDELLALASHQLRTPASGVKQYVGMLTHGILGELTPIQREVAQKAYDANERQLEIINELLYVSKIDAGQLMIEPDKTDIRAIIQKAVDNLEENATAKNIKLVFRNTRPVHAYVDDRYFPMVIENLISNAIKYSYPSSSVNVRIENDDKLVAIHVTDKGVGLAEEDIERIFLKFDRVTNPLSRSEGGSGLGLFLAMELARAQGGDIAVKSKLGQGSTFTVHVPKNRKVYNATVDLQASKNADKEKEK